MRRRVRCLFHPAFLIAWLPTDTRYFRCSVVALSFLCFCLCWIYVFCLRPKAFLLAQRPAPNAAHMFPRIDIHYPPRSGDNGEGPGRRLHTAAENAFGDSATVESLRKMQNESQVETMAIHYENAQGHCDDQVAIRPLPDRRRISTCIDPNVLADHFLCLPLGIFVRDQEERSGSRKMDLDWHEANIADHNAQAQIAPAITRQVVQRLARGGFR